MTNDQLFEDYLTNRIRDGDADKLRNLLSNHADSAAAFVSYVQEWGRLGSVAKQVSANTVPPLAPTSTVPALAKTRLWQAAAAVVAAAVVVAWSALSPKDQSEAQSTLPALSETPTAQTQPPSLPAKPAPPTVRLFSPTADTYVFPRRPKRSFGADPEFVIGGPKNNTHMAYLIFDIAAVGTIESVVLTLPTYGPTGAGQITRLVTTDWIENEVTYRNQPEGQGPSVFFDAPVQGKPVTADLTELVDGPGLSSFRLSSDEDFFVHFRSREHAGEIPELKVIYSNVPEGKF